MKTKARALFTFVVVFAGMLFLGGTFDRSVEAIDTLEGSVQNLIER